MQRLLRVIALAAVLAATITSQAAAHPGNPNFRSVFNSVTPPVPGLRVTVIGYDSQMQIVNRSGKTVLIKGYSNEPYARLLPDGTVQVNQRSPANYLNDDRFARVTVPASASASAPPEWKTLDKTSTFLWHDHRMHWMSTARPPQVKNEHKKTRIFDYQIPLTVNDRSTTLNGTLLWVGPAGSKVPFWAPVSLGIILLLAVFTVVIRRRRMSESSARPTTEGVSEAW